MGPFQILAICILLAITSKYILALLTQQLNALPGPLLARLTNIYRIILLSSGEGPERIRSLHRKYGHIIRTGPHHVYISDPAAIPVIYSSTHQFLKSAFYSVFSLNYKNTTIETYQSTQNPSYHRLLRGSLLPRFSNKAVQSLTLDIKAHVNQFLECMAAREGFAVDIGEWCNFWAYDVASSYTFGHPFGFLDQGKDIRQMIAGVDAGFQYATVIGQVPYLHPFLLGSYKVMGFLRYLRSIDTIQRTLDLPDPPTEIIKAIEQKIDEYEAGLSSFEDTYLRWLCEDRRKDENDLSKQDVISQLFSVVASNSTTATSCTAVFYFLTQNPDVQDLLYKEITENIADIQTTRSFQEQHSNMPYLLAVINESIRLCPTVGLPMERIVPAEGITLCGYHLPGGTNVSMCASVIHHDASIYGSNPEVFRPSRWLEASPAALKAMEQNSLSFGNGIRSCPGKNLAMLEMSELVIGTLRRFRVVWASDEPEWRLKTYWLPKQEKVLVKMIARDL